MSDFPELVANMARRDPDSLDRLTSISQLTGADYLGQIARWLRETLGVFAVLIGELSGARVGVIEVHGFDSREPVDGVDNYELVVSPCQDLVDHAEPVYITHDAQSRFPDDIIFQQNDISSYAGLPLFGQDNRVIGLICVFDDRPMTEPLTVLQTLEWFSGRIANELVGLRSLRNVMGSVGWMAASPDELFWRMTKHLSSVLQVSTALVTEWSENDTFTVTALWHMGERLENYEGMIGKLCDTPSGALGERDQIFIRAGLREAFANMTIAHELSLESYLGVALRSRDGKVIGNISLAHTRCMDKQIPQSYVLPLYATRAAAELERKRGDQERLQMQQALLAKRKLESLGLMAGAIAHDFNNLLVSILGNSSLASDTLAVDDPARAHIDKVETAAVRAGEMVGRLLDYAGRKPEHTQPTSLSELVDEASQLIALSQHPRANVNYDLERGLPMTSVDPAQLQQVVVNLVLNGVEALQGEAGIVAVGTSLVELDDAASDGFICGKGLAAGPYLMLEVRDDGVGIDQERVDRIFDPFYTSKRSGRGLGLAAVRGFVTSHDGGLSIDTRPGRGTCVRVYLACSDATGESPEAEPKVTVHSLHSPVLVIDDEEVVRSVTVALLESSGHRAVACAGGEEALDRMRQGEAFSVALVDVSMPGLDGWETVDRLRQLDPALPVVIMSGYVRSDELAELAEKRQAMYLHKPFRRADVEHCLQRLATVD